MNRVPRALIAGEQHHEGLGKAALRQDGSG
jgi:hypothetical protein